MYIYIHIHIHIYNIVWQTQQNPFTEITVKWAVLTIPQMTGFLMVFIGCSKFYHMPPHKYPNFPSELSTTGLRSATCWNSSSTVVHPRRSPLSWIELSIATVGNCTVNIGRYWKILDSLKWSCFKIYLLFIYCIIQSKKSIDSLSIHWLKSKTRCRWHPSTPSWEAFLTELAIFIFPNVQKYSTPVGAWDDRFPIQKGHRLPGGSISDLSVCVNRFHPEEIVGRVQGSAVSDGCPGIPKRSYQVLGKIWEHDDEPSDFGVAYFSDKTRMKFLEGGPHFSPQTEQCQLGQDLRIRPWSNVVFSAASASYTTWGP